MSYAQAPSIEDSFKTIISQRKEDSNEVNALVFLANQQSQPDSVINYAQQGLLLAQQIKYAQGEAGCYFILANGYGNQGNFSLAIQNGLNALNLYENLRDIRGISAAHLSLQAMYREAGDYKNALMHAFTGEKLASANQVMGTSIEFPGHRLAPLFLAEIAQTYVLMNQLDSALVYTQNSIQQNELFNGAKWEFPIYLLATIQNMQGNFDLALQNYRSALPLAIENGFPVDTVQIYSGMATLFRKMGVLDSAIVYAQKVVGSWTTESERKNLLDAVDNLAQIYKVKGNKDSIIKYIEFSQSLKDKFYSMEKDRAVQNITFNERLKQQEILSAQIRYKNRVQLYGMGAGLFAVLLIAVILWRSNQQKQKSKAHVEKAYTELKSTQRRLIQSEKMASLGQLTAGIAHEIQNPLNFVNNFSEVNSELIAELYDEINDGHVDEAKVIAARIDENEQKINFHGKRADAIVKGMLQHSRMNTGQKEEVDINALADEYLRLGYHGLRAKDKSFHAKLQTDFDRNIAKIKVVPQDIGRVLLNLYNNAFYAVLEKKKLQGDGYEPSISVSTKREGKYVEVRIKDNGNGIPQMLLEKVFQPFFTTKPPGQGTGLGLSISYDVIKAEGGELKVASKEGEGAEFVVLIPAN
jgi:two-component system, NtrC family, sensor kinase